MGSHLMSSTTLCCEPMEYLCNHRFGIPVQIAKSLGNRKWQVY